MTSSDTVALDEPCGCMRCGGGPSTNPLTRTAQDERAVGMEQRVQYAIAMLRGFAG